MNREAIVLALMLIPILLFIAFVCLVLFRKRSRERRIKKDAEEGRDSPSVSAAPLAAGLPATESGARKLLDLILEAAVAQRASSVSIAPGPGRAPVFLEIEGEKRELFSLKNREELRLLLGLLKKRAGFDPGSPLPEKSAGRFRILDRSTHPDWTSWYVKEGTYTILERERTDRIVRMQVSGLLTADGEGAWIEIRRERAGRPRTQFKLGFEPEAEARYLHALQAGSGMILFTGPCNVGKSTATFAGLRFLLEQGRTVATVEFPRHQELRGAQQFEVQKIHNDSEAKEILRQAIARKPDVLLVQTFDWFDGEFEAAVIDYAASGRLVLTAMHFSSISSVFSVISSDWYMWKNGKPVESPNPRIRLKDVLTLIVAPRLLPLICGACAEEKSLPARVLVQAGLADPGRERVAVYHGRGCGRCGGSGYKDWTGIYEVMEITSELRQRLPLAPDESREALVELAWRNGMFTLRECGLLRVLRGDTTLEKVMLETWMPEFLRRARGGQSFMLSSRRWPLKG